jgi:hypothetical protein
MDVLRFTTANAVQIFVAGGFVVGVFELARGAFRRGNKFDGGFFLTLGMAMLVVSCLFISLHNPVAGGG